MIFVGLEKICFEKYVLPISTQNFPKIPKIVLRKPCDEPKHAKTPRERKGLIMLRPGHPGRTFTNVVKNIAKLEKSLGIRYQLSGVSVPGSGNPIVIW